MYFIYFMSSIQMKYNITQIKTIIVAKVFPVNNNLEDILTEVSSPA